MSLKKLYQSYTNEELVEKVQKEGDTDAFDVLYERLRTLIRKLIRRAVFSDSEAPDDFIMLEDEAILNIINSYTPDRKASFTTYATMHIVADLRNYFKMLSRKKRPPYFRAVSLEEVETWHLTEETEGANAERLHALHRAIEEATSTDNVEQYIQDSAFLEEMRSILTDRQYKILVGRYIEGYTCKELAEQLHLHVNRIAREATALKQKIEEYLKNKEGSTK